MKLEDLIFDNDWNALETPGAKQIQPSDDPVLMLTITYQRPDKQAFVGKLPEEFHKYHYLATVASEMSELMASNPDYKGNYIILPNTVKGPGQTRQAALDRMPTSKVWMIDDQVDIRQPYFNEEEGKWKQHGDIVDWGLHLEKIGVVMDHFMHGGTQSAQFCMKYLGCDINCCYRSFNSLFYRTDVMNEIGVKVTDLEEEMGDVVMMEDFSTAIKLLEMGYPSAHYSAILSQSPSGKPGGCTETRSLEVHNRSAEAIAEKHDYVKCVDKVSKTWENDMNVRREIRVQWKRLFKEGCNVNASELR